jgi:hypothetical protein
MTPTNHLVPPPLELVEEWKRTAPHPNNQHEHYRYITLCAAQWGADQELEACCKWLPKMPPWSANDLRKHRRPKPPSLKEQALAVLEEEPEDAKELLVFDTDQVNLIRRALEALPND